MTDTPSVTETVRVTDTPSRTVRWGRALKLAVVALSLVAVTGTPAEAKKRKAPAPPENLQVEILRCHDGDTCTGMAQVVEGLVGSGAGRGAVVASGKAEKIKIRFSGIDAPEARQKFGAEARDFLEARIKGRKVRAECRGKSYDRKTCTLFDGEENINALMVKEGWAWDSPQYSKKEFADLQAEATLAKKGMWREAPEQSPYCFRHKKAKNCRTSQIFNP